MRPTEQQCHGHPVSDELWSLVEQCLKREVTDRATILATLAGLQDLQLRREATSMVQHTFEDMVTASPMTPTITARYGRTLACLNTHLSYFLLTTHLIGRCAGL